MLTCVKLYYQRVEDRVAIILLHRIRPRQNRNMLWATGPIAVNGAYSYCALISPWPPLTCPPGVPRKIPLARGGQHSPGFHCCAPLVVATAGRWKQGKLCLPACHCPSCALPRAILVGALGGALGSTARHWLELQGRQWWRLCGKHGRGGWKRQSWLGYFLLPLPGPPTTICSSLGLATTLPTEPS